MTTMDVRGRVDLTAHGIRATGRVVRNPTTSLLVEHAIARGEARIAEGGPLVVDTGLHTGRSPKDKFVVREPGSEDRIWWDGNKPFSEDGFDRAARQGRRVPRTRGDPLRRRRVRRRGHRSPNCRPGRDHAPVSRAVREDDVHRPDRCGGGGVRAAGARAARARARGEPGSRRNAHRHLRRAASVAHRGADRRHVLRGRDQEVDLHGDERPAAARGRLPHALLGQRRRRRSRRRLLRPVRHGQDDAVRESGARADRRRRAWLGRRRRLQLRGRLLREGDPPVRRRGARDLPDDAHVRDDPGERRDRRVRRARPRRRLEDGEHARRVQARADRERASGQARRPPVRGDHAHRGRVRRSSRRSRG